MRLRENPIGTRNLIGARVTYARQQKGMKQKDLLVQLQVKGIEITSPEYQK